jgi:hypothetical protein
VLKCPKCGDQHATKRYHNGSMACSNERRHSHQNGEHMHIVCGCGYDWILPCLDSENNPDRIKIEEVN